MLLVHVHFNSPNHFQCGDRDNLVVKRSTLLRVESLTAHSTCENEFKLVEIGVSLEAESIELDQVLLRKSANIFSSGPLKAGAIVRSFTDEIRLAK